MERVHFGFVEKKNEWQIRTQGEMKITILLTIFQKKEFFKDDMKNQSYYLHFPIALMMLTP